MNVYITYGIIFMILLILEMCYFKIADKCNIIDKPNERSSHSSIVLRGGGIIFPISTWVWYVFTCFNGFQDSCPMFSAISCLPFIIGLTLIAGMSFADDIRSLPDSARLVVQFIAMGLMFWSIGLFDGFQFSNGFDWWHVFILIGMLLLALIICVGAMNVINFMDGINGITAGYSLAVLVPLFLLNMNTRELFTDFSLIDSVSDKNSVNFTNSFVDQNLIVTSILSILVFCIFNFRPKGKAKCFAGDIGSISIAFIMLFLLGNVIIKTGDVTWLIFLLVYGVDGCLTICHRIILHENLGEAHRKHIYQLMANELKVGHVKISLLYVAIQLVVSLGFIYFCPNIILYHWLYLIVSFVILAILYVVFKKKYYYLHEEYLASLKK